MSVVTATEFAKAFGRYKEEAQREPIARRQNPAINATAR